MNKVRYTKEQVLNTFIYLDVEGEVSLEFNGYTYTYIYTDDSHSFHIYRIKHPITDFEGIEFESLDDGIKWIDKNWEKHNLGADNE